MNLHFVAKIKIKKLQTPSSIVNYVTIKILSMYFLKVIKIFNKSTCYQSCHDGNHMNPKNLYDGICSCPQIKQIIFITCQRVMSTEFNKSFMFRSKYFAIHCNFMTCVCFVSFPSLCKMNKCDIVTSRDCFILALLQRCFYFEESFVIIKQKHETKVKK